MLKREDGFHIGLHVWESTEACRGRASGRRAGDDKDYPSQAETAGRVFRQKDIPCRSTVEYSRLAVTARSHPLIRDIPHGGGCSTLDPGHEGPIKLESRAAFTEQELSDLLRIAVVLVEQGRAGDRSSVPVEAHFHYLGWPGSLEPSITYCLALLRRPCRFRNSGSIVTTRRIQFAGRQVYMQLPTALLDDFLDASHRGTPRLASLRRAGVSDQ